MRCLVIVLGLGLAATPALSACPPELINKMIDQGYSKDQVVSLCSQGGQATASPAPARAAEPAPSAEQAAPQPATQRSAGATRSSESLAQLEMITGTLRSKCEANPGHNAMDDSPCDLYREYSGILSQWQRGQAKCDGGDEAACRTLDEAAGELKAGISSLPDSVTGGRGS